MKPENGRLWSWQTVHDLLDYNHIILSCILNCFRGLVDGQKRVSLRHGLSWMGSQRMTKLCSYWKYSEGWGLVMRSSETWDGRVAVTCRTSKFLSTFSCLGEKNGSMHRGKALSDLHVREDSQTQNALTRQCPWIQQLQAAGPGRTGLVCGVCAEKRTMTFWHRKVSLWWVGPGWRFEKW